MTCSARYTVPIPPSPSWPWSRYAPFPPFGYGRRMSRRLLTLGLVAGATATTAATAASARPAAREATAAKPRRRAGVGRASGTNLPRGFTWPPSQTMLDAEADCERGLDAAGVAWRPADRDGHIVDAVTIDDAVLGGITYTPVFGQGPYKLDCQLALALATIGPELHATGVREVRFGSIYRWSNVRVLGKTRNVLSRHALGLAMDVVSFVDGDGREARVARDYGKGDALLLEIERRIDASRAFRLVLTPKNDPISHRDHFHIEANPSYAAAPPQS